jgi:hypothetical protein
MSTALGVERLVRPVRSPLPTLLGYEVRRLLRNPLFLLVLAFDAYAIYDITSRVIFEADELPAFPAGLLGGIGLIVLCWLTQSTHRSAETLDVTPTAMSVRTTALCLTAAVPFACAVVSLVAVLLVRHPAGSWTYGAFSAPDRAAVQISQIAMPALGGPLLGVAVGRWARQLWVGPAVFLVILGWIELTEGITTTQQNSLIVLLMRLFAPFAFFTVSDGAGASVETWCGSPTAFLAWQLCLCALAVVVALLYRADPPLRRRLINVLVVLIPLTVVSYVLAVTGGLHHAVTVVPGFPPQPI